MKIPTHPNSNIRLASLKKLEERESWHKLVVKIILWKQSTFGGDLVKSASKLTLSEWNKYRRGILKINTTQGRQKILSDLKDTLQKIRQNGGFVE